MNAHTSIRIRLVYHASSVLSSPKKTKETDMLKMFDKCNGFHGRLFGPSHIIMTLVTLSAAVLLVFFLRKMKHKNVRRLMQIFCFFMLVSDMIKWIWELVEFGRIDPAESLPLYTCSIIIFALPFAAFGKGNVQRSALSFICTLNVMGAFLGVILSKLFVRYPFYHLNVLNSFLYHGVLIFLGLLPWATRYYVPEKRDLGLFFIPFLAMAVPVIILNGIFHWDYMFLHDGAGTPFNILSRMVPPPVYIFLVILGYYAAPVVLFYVPTIVRAVKARRARKRNAAAEIAAAEAPCDRDESLEI